MNDYLLLPIPEDGIIYKKYELDKIFFEEHRIHYEENKYHIEIHKINYNGIVFYKYMLYDKIKSKYVDLFFYENRTFMAFFTLQECQNMLTKDECQNLIKSYATMIYNEIYNSQNKTIGEKGILL